MAIGLWQEFIHPCRIDSDAGKQRHFRFRGGRTGCNRHTLATSVATKVSLPGHESRIARIDL